MPFLKQKILKALQQRLNIECLQKEVPKPLITYPETPSTIIKQEARPKKGLCLSREVQSKPNSKNIVKNFGKAMCSFASSKLALPYLEQIHTRIDFHTNAFQKHMHAQLKTIDSLHSVRSLFYIESGDSETTAVVKRVFQEISIVFIKYFSVNWICQGKMSHKEAHLRARFKMLRRVKEPEFFTYFKEFPK